MKRARHAFLVSLFLLLLCSCSFLGGGNRGALSSSPYPSLKNQIDMIIASELYPYSSASIKIVSLKTGATIYESRPRMLMAPASLEKLFTAAAALRTLGAEHAMETSVHLIPGRGEIYIKGCGDPLMTPEEINILARFIAGNLMAGTRCQIIGDIGCFDDDYWGDGWAWDDDPDDEAVYISALSVNGNSVLLDIGPGKAPSQPLSVKLFPDTRYVAVENRAITGKPGDPCALSIARPAGDLRNHIFIGGSLAPECPAVEKKLPVWRPELYFLALLAEQLGRAGIVTDSINLGRVPDRAVHLVSIKRPVGKIVGVMLKKSDNLCGENLLKYLGHRRTGKEGTAEDGALVIRDYLKSNGIPFDHVRIADGSGMSHYNLNNAETIVRLLAAVYRDRAVYPEFVNSLPVAGRDGTLVNRMKGTPAEGKVRGKTGSLMGISTLAGYTETADGEPVAFAMLMENFTGPTERVRNIQDRIAVLISVLSVKGP
ncbi:MAG: D-alanyl-D-alanine carboxypeptidase/D-alanyl-D-alanine-endopeptidase [Syntrophaceae bacterium]